VHGPSVKTSSGVWYCTPPLNANWRSDAAYPSYLQCVRVRVRVRITMVMVMVMVMVRVKIRFRVKVKVKVRVRVRVRVRQSDASYSKTCSQNRTTEPFPLVRAVLPWVGC
jgi:hypothetical protein